ncbi:hypothetical protein BDZ91DRAFT_732102 [Kalaharituber pfeilii]|nr:hypothetical protein BDZ91DRAFT_732102 [Kalaharituber pfeilii]
MDELEEDDIDAIDPESEDSIPVHEVIVRLLLDRSDIQINLTDKNGETPLFRAISRCCEGIVRLLLDRSDIDINLPNKEGTTPFYNAVQWGIEDISCLLLDRSDIDINLSHKGHSPLSARPKRRRYQSDRQERRNATLSSSCMRKRGHNPHTTRPKQ